MITPRTSAEPPQYRLACEPDQTSWTTRENLTDLLDANSSADEPPRGNHRRLA